MARAALATIALIATAVIALRRADEVTPAAGPVQFTIAPPENTSFGGPPPGGTGVATQVAISPDGRNIVFVAGARPAYQIWLRPVAALAARPIPGTEGGTFPFWSPDSRFIGFFAGGKLKKVQIAGGPPIVLCDASAGNGGSWSRDNVILFAPGRRRRQPPARVKRRRGADRRHDPRSGDCDETRHRWPHFLPDGRHFIYTEISGPGGPGSKPSMIRIGSLDPAEAAITLLQADSSVSYASGHLLFARGETLMAQPFDPDTRQPKGDAFPLAEQVSSEGSRYVGASVSENGTLVYARDDSRTATRLTWLDRAGRALATLGEAARYINLALSPDERRVAVALATGSPENIDIWIIDIPRNVRSRLTVDPGTDGSPVWSQDGTRIAFVGQRSGKVSLRQQLINGTAADESLLEGSGNITNITPSGWSADGRFIAYTLHNREVSAEIRCLGPSVVRRSQTVSACTNRVHRDRRSVLSGWTVDRVHDQRKRPDQRLRSTVSPGRREISGIKGRREPACLASGRQGIVLPRSGRDPDGGADRRDRSIRCRSAAGPLPHGRAGIRQQPGLRRDEGWAAIPGQREASAGQRGAADRRRQLDGRDPEIAAERESVHGSSCFELCSAGLPTLVCSDVVSSFGRTIVVRPPPLCVKARFAVPLPKPSAEAGRRT